MSGVDRYAKSRDRQVQAPPPRTSFPTLGNQETEPSPTYASFQRPYKPPRISAPPRPHHLGALAGVGGDPRDERGRSNSADFFQQPASPPSQQVKPGSGNSRGALTSSSPTPVTTSMPNNGPMSPRSARSGVGTAAGIPRRWPQSSNGSASGGTSVPSAPTRQPSNRRIIRQLPKKVQTHVPSTQGALRMPLQSPSSNPGQGRKTMPAPTRKPINKATRLPTNPSSRSLPGPPPTAAMAAALSPKMSSTQNMSPDASSSAPASSRPPISQAAAHHSHSKSHAHLGNREPTSSAPPPFTGGQHPHGQHHPHALSQVQHRATHAGGIGGASGYSSVSRSATNLAKQHRHNKSPSLSASSNGSSSSTSSSGNGNGSSSHPSPFASSKHKSSHTGYPMAGSSSAESSSMSQQQHQQQHQQQQQQQPGGGPSTAGRRFCPKWDCRIRIVSQTARYCEQCGTVLDSPPVERGAPPVERVNSKTSGLKDILKANLASQSVNASAPVTMQREKSNGTVVGKSSPHNAPRGSMPKGLLQHRVSLENFLNEGLPTPEDEHELSFEERLWDNVAGVIEHNKSVSRETTKTLLKYFKELSEIETSYGKALWKHALTADVQELGTFKAGWDAFRKVQYQAGIKHCARASEMGKHTVDKLSALLDHLTETHTNLVETMRTSEKRLEAVNQTYEKTKSKYRQAHEKEQQLVQKLEVLQSKGQIPVGKLNKQRDRLKQASDETREANEAQNVAENAVFAMTSSNQQTTSTVLKSYESLELERIGSLVDILQADFNLMFEHRAETTRDLEDCRRKVLTMNPHHDVLEYVKSVETGKKCPYDSSALVNSTGVSAPVLTSRSDVGAHRENLGKGGLANKSTRFLMRMASSLRQPLLGSAPVCYEQLEDGNIRFFAKTSVGAAIIMTLDFKDQSIRFSDTTGVLKKEIFAIDVIQVLVQVDRKTRVVAQVPTTVGFQQFNDQYMVTMQADADIRLFLCDQLRRLDKRLKIEGADVDPEVVRFNVHRAGKLEVIGGPKKADVVLLDARYRKMRFAKSSTEINVANITRAEKSVTNNRFLSLQLQNHEDLTLQFENAEQRKQFLGALWRIRKNLSLSDVEMKESAASPDNELHVWVGSWNLGECSYFFEDAEQAVLREPRNLSEWIVGGQDIYVIGFQECPSKKREDWIKGVLAQICATSQSAGINDRYHLLAERHMLEIVCFVVVREPLLASISTVESAQVATGIGGVIGNKGAVGITLTINDTSLCFVLVHFAARAERLEQRKNNFHEITRDLALGSKDEDLLEQFDHVFWFGDLNYRVEMEFNHVVNLVEQCQFDQLWATDQLQREIDAGNVFNEFQEGALNFAPTYRMMKDRHGYSNKRAQPPSYTDRVLWKSLPHARDLTHVSMNGCRNTFGSDHRPIFALFNLQPRIPQFQSWKQRLQDDSRYEITLSNVQASASSAATANSARSTTAPPINSALCLCVQHPYSENIVLSEDVLFDGQRSGWIWGDAQISPMRLFINDIHYLSGTHLFIRLKVSDSNRYDAFGHCVVSLANVFSRSPVPFSRPISRHGHMLGKLTGYIQGTRRF